MLPILSGKEREIGRAQRIFQGSKTVLFGTTEVQCMSLCICQSLECLILKVDPNIKYTLWVVLTCPCRFVDLTPVKFNFPVVPEVS